MFRSIRSSLQRRQQDLEVRSSASVLVKKVVKDFISERYPDAVTAVTVRYEPAERLVVVTTPSKTLAGELLFNTREIRAHLTAHNIPVDRIIAR